MFPGLLANKKIAEKKYPIPGNLTPTTVGVFL
jgi:hypothetical protein